MSKLIVTASGGNTVNLRSTPSLSSSVLIQVKINSKVDFIEKVNDDWNKVRYGRYEGYMMAKFLKDPEQTKISQDDLRAVYDSLKETLALIEKVLK